MGDTRSSPPADADVRGEAAAFAPVLAAVRRSLQSLAAGGSGARVAVALSGGRDSMVLLDAMASLAPSLGVAISAVHVHHGLSPHADDWALFCAEQCARRDVALIVHRVDVKRSPAHGLEAAARHARYDALAATDADAVALAHHADDQAETVLLQLLRGAGVHGLAAMSSSRAAAHAVYVRPLLVLARRALDRYAEARALEWVDDESNDDRAHARNFVRHALAPQIAAAFAGYPATLVRAAAHQAEAAQLLDELAEHDAQGALVDGTLERERIASLAAEAPHRARNLLRWFLRLHGLRAPSSARLAAMLDQLARAAPDARVRLTHDGGEIGIHRGRVVVHAPPVEPFAVRWSGETLLTLPHGTLEFAPASGEGLDANLVRDAVVVVRSRAGGERIRLAHRGARQAVKHLLQQAGVAHWARADLPLVWCGDRLAAVPGIGVDAAFAAAADAPSFAVRWHPNTR